MNKYIDWIEKQAKQREDHRAGHPFAALGGGLLGAAAGVSLGGRLGHRIGGMISRLDGQKLVAKALHDAPRFPSHRTDAQFLGTLTGMAAGGFAGAHYGGHIGANIDHDINSPDLMKHHLADIKKQLGRN